MRGKKGAEYWQYADLSKVAPGNRSRAVWRADGRFEVYLNVYTNERVDERHGKKAMKDLFIDRFGVSPSICIVDVGNKLRGRDIFLNQVSWYARMEHRPDRKTMEGLDQQATEKIISY